MYVSTLHRAIPRENQMYLDCSPDLYFWFTVAFMSIFRIVIGEPTTRNVTGKADVEAVTIYPGIHL